MSKRYIVTFLFFSCRSFCRQTWTINVVFPIQNCDISGDPPHLSDDWSCYVRKWWTAAARSQHATLNHHRITTNGLVTSQSPTSAPCLTSLPLPEIRVRTGSRQNWGNLTSIRANNEWRRTHVSVIAHTVWTQRFYTYELSSRRNQPTGSCRKSRRCVSPRPISHTCIRCCWWDLTV